MPGPAKPAVSAPGRTGQADAGGAGPRLVLAFDYGRRRIGVACGDTLSRTAQPLTGIVNDATGRHWDGIAALLRDWQPALIVVGLPYNVDGSESAMSKAARGFALQIEARHAVQVHLVDERYSSLEAESRLRSERESGARKRKVARSDLDAAAACVILERWFAQTGR